MCAAKHIRIYDQKADHSIIKKTHNIIFQLVCRTESVFKRRTSRFIKEGSSLEAFLPVTPEMSQAVPSG